MTTSHDTCKIRQYVDAIELNYNMHPDVSPADGVSLFIRHSHLIGSVEYASGNTAMVTFYHNGKWSVDFGQPTVRQAAVLDRIAGAGLGNIKLGIGATPHHLLFQGMPAHKGTQRMFMRRLGLDLGAAKYDGHTLDTVTMPGASIQYTCTQNYRHSL